MQYDPENPMPAKEWLALSRKQRRDLATEYVRRTKPGESAARFRAVLAAAIETQLAIGLPGVCEVMLSERQEGGSRWGTLTILSLEFLEQIERAITSETAGKTYRGYSRYLNGTSPCDGFDNCSPPLS